MVFRDVRLSFPGHDDVMEHTSHCVYPQRPPAGGVANEHRIEEQHSSQVGLGHFRLQALQALFFQPRDIDSLLEIDVRLPQQVKLMTGFNHEAASYGMF